MVCHLFIATNQVSSFFRQLRSMTSFSLSPSSAARTELSRSCENFPSGKRKDVIMTYCLSQRLSVIWYSFRATSRSSENKPALQRWLRHTLSAPHSIHCFAFLSVMPPPICKPPFHSANASFAASSFPGPSIITCAPSNPLSLYSFAKWPAGSFDT